MVLYLLMKHMIYFLNEKKRHLSPVVAWRNKLWFLLETSEAIYYYCHGTIIQERNTLLECTVQTGPLSQEGYLVPLTVLSLHTGRTVSGKLRNIYKHTIGLANGLHLVESFPETVFTTFPFTHMFKEESCCLLASSPQNQKYVRVMWITEEWPQLQYS